MKFFTNNLNNKHVLIAFVIFSILSFSLTRLVNLKVIPIFTDEAIYAHWAQIALNDPANRFISMEDGKQPLFIWLAGVSQHFISDSLVAIRLVSIIAGFGSMWGIFFLTRNLFSNKVAMIATVLYIFLPFTLLYDRLGLFDSLLTMLCIWAVYLTVRLAKRPQLDLSIINGFTLGLATITKSSGFFFIYLLPFSILLFDFKRGYLKGFFKWVGLTVLSFLIAELIYNLLRLSPFFYIIARKNHEFIRPLNEVIFNPFVSFVSNGKSILDWLAIYMGIPLFLIFLLGLIYALIIYRDKKIYYLTILMVIPLLAELIFNKILYPRFILFYFPFILIITAFVLEKLSKKYVKSTILLLLIVLVTMTIPIYSSLKLLSEPTQAAIPKADSAQYLNDWPAGYGVREVISFLEGESRKGEVHIGTEGTFGLFPFSINVYFYGNNNVHVYAYWPVDSNKIPPEIIDLARDKNTYFVFNENQKEINSEHLKLIAKYKKGLSENYMRLYKVSP